MRVSSVSLALLALPAFIAILLVAGTAYGRATPRALLQAGGVSFTSAVGNYTPYNLITNSNNGQGMFVAYFGDVDTRDPGSGLVTYYSSTDDTLLGIAASMIGGSPALSWIFIASYPNVGYYYYNITKLNNFQLMLARATDGRSFNCFFYQRLEWTTGDASNGVDGLDGFPARAGYTDGVGHAYELPGSGTMDVLNLASTSNGGRLPGQWCYQVNGAIIDACATDNGGCDALTSCTNSDNGPVCGPCPEHYTGTGATGCVLITVPTCATSNPCQNGGSCVDSDTGPTCDCSLTSDFTGQNCTTQIDDCSSTPCLNGGICADGPRSYTCDCAGTSDFVGTNCETRIDNCDPNPCQNGGTCTDGDRAYTCTCANACFSGTTCGTLNFGGFFPPVANMPGVNTVKAGQAVPVKFTLGCGDLGTAIFASGYPSFTRAACDGTKDNVAPVSTVNPGSSSLSYDATSRQYNYVWKTPSDGAVGTCQVLTVRFVDGTERSALFKFRK
ncbi:hypothetical protein HYH03_013620 [Edaphochlamys debaryana]|uniref:Uncharacterized protein n=1 Tax=Edaphochlamys debaryana TaxID=47281 RepID=A0A835XVV5_9CHLO|nr:hypothetical protein HYH03_013620 [Edaphochlamys debaryana]|eukprot:KAG2487775.1 hypothetical protein HYH03_013620 [Edaphochlamys debaryana]